MREIIIFIALTVLLGGCTIAVAHGPDQPAHEVLGINKPVLLPDSVFYFFKDIGRGLRLFFAFDEVKKTELELRFSDERLVEIDTLATKKPDKQSALESALQNYLEAQNRLQARLESLRDTNKNVDSLLAKLADRVIEHKDIFERLEEVVTEEKIKGLSRGIAKIAKKALDIDGEKFKEKIKEKVKRDEDDNKENLEILEDLQDFDEELKEDLEELEEELRDEAEKDELDEDRALEELEESQEDIKEYKNKVAAAKLDEKSATEAKRLLEEAEKHWGLAKKSAEKANLAEVKLHLGHIEGFLENLEEILDKQKGSKKPEFCILLYDPVCGEDGKTYSNECFAELADIDIEHRGECKKP